MHMLYLMPADGFGGAERQGILHIEWLRRLGHSVTVVVGRSPPMLRKLTGDDDEDHSLWLDDFPPAPSGNDNPLDTATHGLRWLRSLRRTAGRLEPIVASRQIDIVFANRTFAWIVAALLRRRTGIPFVIRAGSRPRKKALARGLRLLSALDVEPALFVSNCRAVENCFQSYLRAPRMILPNAVDADEFRPRDAGAACQRLGLDHARPRVALAIRPSADKGLDLLFEVAARIRMIFPTVEFVIAGEYPERRRYMAKVSQRYPKGLVRFLGHINDVAELYAASDVVLLTSPKDSIEGSPNALLEAMACGKPIVATAVGGIPELVRDGLEGLLLQEAQPSSIVSAIDLLLRDSGMREHMGMAGRRRAKQDHVPRVIAQQLVERIAQCVVFNDESGAPIHAC